MIALFFQTNQIVQNKVAISFKNDYEDVYHLSLIIYTPDGKNQTRVSNVSPAKLKTYELPVGTEIYVADYKQEIYAMQGNDIKTTTNAKPFIILKASDDQQIINLSSIKK